MNWTICEECQGRGKKSRRLSKKARLIYEKALEKFEKSKSDKIAPIRPNAHLYSCPTCSGSGLISSQNSPIPDKENYPHVAIIGGGIGGVALGVACLHRRIPFTIYERDNHFDARSQGYGLTLQQASKAMQELGIFSLEQGVNSTRHIVHTTDGKVIGEWGMRKQVKVNPEKPPKRTNVHIARQSLRSALLKQLGGSDNVTWGHQLKDLRESKNDQQQVELSFEANGTIKKTKADLVVGADGIFSTVRQLQIGDEVTPLQYLGCIVILGICPIENLQEFDHPLLDSATVFQTANGHERIYMMPFTKDSIMWQLSFPMKEEEAKKLSFEGSDALKKEAQKRTQWHNPIPQILEATESNQISGYPVYDRELLKPELLKQSNQVTLIGDAAHPMSPFKGQGANQALLDALSLAREITRGCKPHSEWGKFGIRERVLNEFESEMIIRSAKKVKDSAKAAQLLHSDLVLKEANSPRGRVV
ncbi:MAG: FAD-dependent oxidoreductase [Ekhidna sp.]